MYAKHGFMPTLKKCWMLRLANGITRQIQRLTGLTPGRYIREVQLQVARTQLESGTALSVKEVCFNAGFEQASTFSTLFKKRFGVAPSEYMGGGKLHFTQS